MKINKGWYIVIGFVWVIWGFFMILNARVQRDEARQALSDSKKQIEKICLTYPYRYDWGSNAKQKESGPVFMFCNPDQARPGYFEVVIGTLKEGATPNYLEGVSIKHGGVTEPWKQFDPASVTR